MRNDKLAMRNEPSKINYRGALLHFSLLSSLLLFSLLISTGCDNPLNNYGGHGSGTGSLTLVIAGEGSRTILPSEGPDTLKFAVYTLAFTPTTSGVALNVDRNSPDISTPINLEPGTYNVSVTAYLDGAKTKPAAQGSLNGIPINAGQNTTRSITLSALISSGKGRFAWNINFSGDFGTGLKEGRIKINRVDGTGEQTLYLGNIEAGKIPSVGMTDSIELDSGYYRIWFIFAKDGAQRIEWREILHIYQNMESVFEYTFTQAHFSNISYTVTYVFNDGVTPDLVQDRLHGETATLPVPTRVGFRFDGWYADVGFATVYDAGTRLTSSITLYAKWRLLADEDDFGPDVVTTTFNVANTIEWNDAISAITGGGNNRNYIINVVDDFSVAGRTTAIFGSVGGITISLRGSDKIMTLSNNGNLLRIADNQKVILRDLTLRGRSSNNNSLVYVSSGGTFTMHGGKITGNASSPYSGGGGVRMSGGTFTMNGGEISDNTSDYGGGGVYLGSGTFTMNGGEISGNTSSRYGGGGVILGGGNFTMNGGEISGNTSTCGGGVSMRGGNFTMNGGGISSNIASPDSSNEASFLGGGVILTDGNFTLNGGEISGNTASTNGGGVYMDGGTFTLKGGEISGNTASTNGGGVSVGSSGTFRIVTGTVYGSNETDTSLRNTASTGAALRSSGTTEFGIFSGSAWIHNGILGTTNDTISVVDGVWQGIGVITPQPDGHEFNVATTLEWNSALSSISIYGSNKNYTINVTADFSVLGRTADSFGNASGITVTLQGPGRTLTLSGNGNILRTRSNQNIILKDLTLKGHGSNNTSLVCVYGANANFTMHSGKISSNTSSSSSYGYYGGVYVNNDGIFTMNGGEISGNTASSSASAGGGVVLFDGTFTMNSGKISGNTASYGGGVSSSGGIFTMNGGEISGNTASFNGGGVYVDGGTFRIVTGTVYGANETNTTLKNTAGTGVVLYWSSGTAEYGTFSGNTWNSNGSLYNINDTIRVVNGELPGITPMPNGHIFNVATNAEWYNAVGSIVFYGSNKNYTINVTADFSVEGRNVASFSDTSGITVTLQSAGRTLSLSGNGRLLSIRSHQTVILQNLTLRGHDSNNTSLVSVYGTNANFTMQSGKISSNTNTSFSSIYGGGVSVDGNATFTMNGGEISDNTSSSNNSYNGGGGVTVFWGTFTMNGGIISGNTTISSSYYYGGGGVYVEYGNTFTKTGGTITGYASDTANGNVVKNSSGVVQNSLGHAVCVHGDPMKRRETTAGPGVNLNSNIDGEAGGWEEED
jgi:uncharacterized repeat protein (TIGR02543 family)